MVRRIGMDAVSNHIPENQWPARSNVHGFVCKQAIITTPSVRKLETRPSGMQWPQMPSQRTGTPFQGNCMQTHLAV